MKNGKSRKIRRGRMIAKVLNLDEKHFYAEDDESIRYETLWGTKTALGLYETVKRILEDESI